MQRIAVVGSGAAGLAAALAARHAGAEVTVYERHEAFGGTTALSGGNAWMPANRFLAEDSPEEALRYLRSLALGDANDDLLSVFVHEAAGVADWLEEHTPVRWQSVPYADYHAEFDGGRPQGGRSLEPQPYDAELDVVNRVRTAPHVTAPITYRELAGGELDLRALARRTRRGSLTLGRGLIAALLQGCIDAGVALRADARIRTPAETGADRVVLATGGFERDPLLATAFLRGPVAAPTGVPTADGDGLRMAMAAGASLGGMSEAWWAPAYRVPGESIDGTPMFRLLLEERARPGSIIVDRSGRRFADEAQNYNDLGRVLLNFDAITHSLPHVPAWLVMDAACRRGSRIGPLGRRDPDPEWLARAETVGELARAIGVPPASLEEQVQRFNADAVRGKDPEFGRGSVPYDRFIGGIAPLSEGPYYALRLLPGCLGTKGGPRTDTSGRVLSIVDGSPIPGLYAAGNVAASPYGFGYPGAGATLGPALVFGMRAGAAAADD